MHKSKTNLFKYDGIDKRLNSFFLNSNYSESNNDNKNVQHMNFKKCEKASILLDNFNILNQITLKEEIKCSQKNSFNDFIIYNYDNKIYENSADSNSATYEKVFDLTKFKIKEKNYENSLNKNLQYENYQNIYENKTKNIYYSNEYEKDDDVYYQKIVCNNYKDGEHDNGSNIDENLNHIDSYQNEYYNYHDELQKYKGIEKNDFKNTNICKNNKKRNNSKKKYEKYNCIENIFDLKKEKDLVEKKKNNWDQMENKNEMRNKVDIVNKNNNNNNKKKFLKENNVKIIKKSEAQLNYEKLLKEKVTFHEEEKEKIKKSFEHKLEEITKNYEEEKEKKKNLINNIYTKYINIKNLLIKANNEKHNLKEENDKLKEELKNPANYSIESNVLNNYKEKLEYYISLSENKDIKIKNLEEELKTIKKNLLQKEEKNYIISEEKTNMYKMNMLLKKDTTHLQKKLENLKNIKEEMKEMLFYKEMKINYLVNILNILDESIMNENEIQKQHKNIENDKKEIDAIKNINKKIIIKSILHKIKDLNKKIKKHGEILTNFQTEDDNFLYNKDEIISKNYHNNKKEKNDNELFDNYFNSQNFILNEDEHNLMKENETVETFFTNYNINNTNDVLKNNLEAKLEIQSRQNSNTKVKIKGTNNNSQII
ncbi:conserved Plasmodium protein, unknown function [Plasmodium relictum]|uniref:Uncharacterized protein n=1 Tax=Plasmodium relictum TaxID=85471 RepID=A0A1J1H1N0_PLARL|nr:conserved Plasmodium protein, unknown function [Plasmodium relictum]CRG98826.1 conserved Plasmodium protein, unknown function [Plasmodium relictum]